MTTGRINQVTLLGPGPGDGADAHDAQEPGPNEEL